MLSKQLEQLKARDFEEIKFRHFVDEGVFTFASAEVKATGKLYLFRITNGRGPVEIYTGGRFISLPEEIAYQLRQAIAWAEERTDVPTYSTHNGRDAEQGLR